MNLSTESNLQVSICRQGLRTLLSHCGANLTNEEEGNGYEKTRIHNLCSRVVSNLTKHKRNRNDIYKAELEFRTKQTQEMMATSIPRRPTTLRSSSVLASPRRRRNEEKERDSSKKELKE
jgi:hypothetical protein